jgi:hypothetical protein
MNKKIKFLVDGLVTSFPADEKTSNLLDRNRKRSFVAGNELEVTNLTESGPYYKFKPTKGFDPKLYYYVLKDKVLITDVYKIQILTMDSPTTGTPRLSA